MKIVIGVVTDAFVKNKFLGHGCCLKWRDACIFFKRYKRLGVLDLRCIVYRSLRKCFEENGDNSSSEPLYKSLSLRLWISGRGNAPRYPWRVAHLVLAIESPPATHHTPLPPSLWTLFWRKCQLGKKKLFTLRMAKVHQEVTSYVLIDWMGGPDGKICGSRSGQHQMCVLAESQILSGPALPTIDDTQLGSHCSDTCLYLFQCCFEMVFWWTWPSSRPTLGGKGKRARAQNVNVIPLIDPSSNVTDCSSVNQHFIIWNLCFWIFFDGAKTHSWQHLPRFARAFLRRAVRVFSALSLDAYRPHTELFSQGFPTKLRTGTCHMITYLIILACVTPKRFNLRIFTWIKLRLRRRVSLMSTPNHDIFQDIFQQ